MAAKRTAVFHANEFRSLSLNASPYATILSDFLSCFVSFHILTPRSRREILLCFRGSENFLSFSERVDLYSPIIFQIFFF